MAGRNRSADDVLRGLASESTSEWVGLYDRSEYPAEFITAQGSQPTEVRNQPLAPKAKFANGVTPWWTLVRRSVTVKVKDHWNSARFY